MIEFSFSQVIQILMYGVIWGFSLYVILSLLGNVIYRVLKKFK